VTSADDRPVLTVLCATGGDRPPLLAPVEERTEVRWTDPAGLGDAVVGADALLLWDFFSTAVSGVWDRADRLAWIHVAAAGVDKLLFPALVASDVTVTNARGVFDRPMAEYVLGMCLAHAKRLPAMLSDQLTRTWRHRETDSLTGSRALVVGTGAIGREIARLLSLVGVDVRGAGRTARPADPDFGDVLDSADLASYVGDFDHVVLVTPLTEQTRGLVGREVLAAMRPTAHLVNVGRGPVVDEAALVQELRDGGIAAASLDVFATEPLPDDSPLWSMPQVVVTPHMSGDARGWEDTLARQFADNALRWLDGRPLLNVVDKRLGFVPSGDPS
jgi:phosphoglycerate dehydrogenase-like enzyme